MAQNHSMAVTSSTELLEAQAELWRHTFSYLKSMALQCAIKLGIPNAVHRSGGAASLSELLAALPLAPNKHISLARLMRFLTMSGIFACAPAAAACDGATATMATTQDVYSLTPVSRLLVTEDTRSVDGHTSLSLFVLCQITPFQVNAALHLAKWFGSDEAGEEDGTSGVAETPFKMAHGADFWGVACSNPEFNEAFNDGMGSDSRFAMELAVRECPEVFAGISSLMDVGGGNGTAARAIAKAFPHVKCSVLDLPQVIQDVPTDETNQTIEFIAGDMMEYIPQTGAILLKYVLHDWSDQDCVKILAVCKRAISSEKSPGKVIIIDTVVGISHSSAMYEAQLLLDLAMMVFTPGKEREEHEWKKIFTEAGFKSYKILPILGILSVIELYPNVE